MNVILTRRRGTVSGVRNLQQRRFPRSRTPAHLVPKLRLGTHFHETPFRVSHTDRATDIHRKQPLCRIQLPHPHPSRASSRSEQTRNGVSREGVPKRSLGTRRLAAHLKCAA